MAANEVPLAPTDVRLVPPLLNGVVPVTLLLPKSTALLANLSAVTEPPANLVLSTCPAAISSRVIVPVNTAVFVNLFNV